MFIIIGGDGKEYGPVTVEQIRTWLAGGRANLDTKAKALGTDEWRPLGDYAEFSGPGEPPVIATGTPTADGRAPADRGTRLAAWCLDQIIGFFCVLPGGLLLGLEFFRAALSGDPQAALAEVDPAKLLLGCALLLGAMLILFIVQVWLLTTRGQTIGKRVLGIRIVRFADGANPGFVTAVLMRAMLPGLIGAIPWIGMIFSLVNYSFIFRDDRRCLHDLMAGTRVVKA